MLFVTAAIFAQSAGLRGDEMVHFQQVEWLLAGHYAAVPDLTTIPGFHALVALALRLAGVESLAAARVVTMAFALAAVLGFRSLRQMLAPGEDPSLATVQFLFLPILFPFSFLLYTDVPSVALVLWMLRLGLARRHIAAGTLGILALLFRQTNVAWITFVAVLFWVDAETEDQSAATPLRRASVLWPYAIGIGSFFAYWLWNGRISLSAAQAAAHPDLRLHTGNLFFLLFLCAILFLPLLPLWLTRYAVQARSRPALLAIPLALAALYALSFRVDHPYNLILPEYVLRNGILTYVTAHRAAFAAFGAIAAIAGAALCAVRLQRRSFVLLYPATMLIVSASWLIETRYDLIPLTFFLAFRQMENRLAEGMLALFWMPCGFIFLFAMLDLRFFL